MINQQELTGDWIQQVAARHKADPLLAEKVIRALLLLEGLAKQKLAFVFKGGTALMLHFNSAKRLSIDIDIILPEYETDVEAVLKEVAAEQGFTRYELQHRSRGFAIEKAHYKLFYKPCRGNTGQEEYVLLDILFQRAHYTNMIKLPVESSFLPQTGAPLQVETPSIEDLLGDKLTAFAPNTTGIPYFKNDNSMSMEIIKQLYDVANLFDKADNLQVVKETFRKFAKAELGFRNQERLTEVDIIKDIFQTSLNLSTRGKHGNASFEELQNGIRRIRNYIYSEPYHIEKAITDASKAAYIATILEYDADTIERFDQSTDMKDWVIRQPFFTRINKLKKSNPEAFFYWYKIFKLTTK